MKIYISGKISGMAEEEVARKFSETEVELRRGGCESVNPYQIGIPYEIQWMAEGLSERERWERHMDRDLDLLRGCDGIYMLDNWTSSRGAIIELKEAISHHFFVYGHATKKQIAQIRLQ